MMPEVTGTVGRNRKARSARPRKLNRIGLWWPNFVPP